MKRFGIVLSVAGALTLVAHLLHAHFLSGTELARYRVMSGPGSWVDASGNGFLGAAGAEKLHHAGPFTLDPDMNPLRAVLEVRRDDAAAAAGSVIYGARLVDEGGATVWSGSGVHRKDDGIGAPGSSLSVSLDAFEVEKAGRYVLLLDPEEGGGATLGSSANIILQRNVAQARPTFAVAGLLALAAGVVLLLLGAWQRRPVSSEQPGAE